MFNIVTCSFIEHIFFYLFDTYSIFMKGNYFKEKVYLNCSN